MGTEFLKLFYVYCRIEDISKCVVVLGARVLTVEVGRFKCGMVRGEVMKNMQGWDGLRATSWNHGKVVYIYVYVCI